MLCGLFASKLRAFFTINPIVVIWRRRSASGDPRGSARGASAPARRWCGAMYDGGAHARITAKHHAHLGQYHRGLVDERRSISDAASATFDAQCDEAKGYTTPRTEAAAELAGRHGRSKRVSSSGLVAWVALHRQRCHIERMERRHPHSEAIYSVVPQPDLSFGVVVAIPDTHPTTVTGFATQEAAEAWVQRHKHAATLPFFPPRRRWSGSS